MTTPEDRISTWPKYISHKIVQATPIVRIDPGESWLPLLFVDPSNGAPEPFFPTEANMANRCQVGDYAMIYRDGYQSVCPKKEFDEGYSTFVEVPQ